MDIGPGDVVICIETMDDADTGLSIVAGRRYTVESAFVPPVWAGPCPCHDRTDQLAIRLAEVCSPDGLAWCSLCFTKRPPSRDAWIRELEKPVVVSEPVDLRELVR